jgi:hypothetical protein
MKNTMPNHSKNRRFLIQTQQMFAILLIVFTINLCFLNQAQASKDIDVNHTLATPQEEPQAYQLGKKSVKDMSQEINNTLENVKEKLNLDEPLPESTKEFLANPLAKPKDQNIPERPVGSNV